MVLLSLVRLRRLQRATKFVLALLFACLISYFVFTFYKWPIKAASPIYFHILSNGTGYTRALNVHIWRGLCGLNVSFLYNSPLFPRYPDEKLTISEFQTEDKDTDFGELIFGFIHPSKTGLYRFGIASDDTSELWLSPGEDPTEKRLIARVYSATESAWTEKGDLKKYSEQISSEINLVVGGKYYIEAIVKQSAGIGFIQVYWASPPDSEFQIISSEYLSLFSYDPVVVAKKDVLHKIYRATGVSKKRDNTFDRQYLAFYSLPRLPKGHFLPPCVYKSSFVLKDKIAQYNGIRVIYESNVYPGDDTEMSTPDKVWSWRNRVADKELIHSIVQKIVASLQLSTSK